MNFISKEGNVFTWFWDPLKGPEGSWFSYKLLRKNREGCELYYYVMVIKKMITRLYNVEYSRSQMYLFNDITNFFLQEYFRMAAAKPPK